MRPSLALVLPALVVLAPTGQAQPAHAEVALEMDQTVVDVRPDLPALVWVTVTAHVRCAYGAPPPPDLELRVVHPGAAREASPNGSVGPERFRLTWTSAGSQLTGSPLSSTSGFHDWEILDAVNATATASPGAESATLDHRWLVPSMTTDAHECTEDGLYHESAWHDFQVVVHAPEPIQPAAGSGHAMLPLSRGPDAAGTAVVAALAAAVAAVLLHVRRRLG